MTRRARRNLPPRLGDTPQASGGRSSPAATIQAQLVAAHVAGSHPRLGRAEVEHAVAQLTTGAPGAMLGLDLGRVSRDEAWDAIAHGWGYVGDEARASIDADRAVDGFVSAVDRLRAVAERGGRVAFATARPASLLGLFARLAEDSARHGARVLDADSSGATGRGRRMLWWHEQIAVMTDGQGLLAGDAQDLGSEWLFTTGRPDLAIADLGFAGAALAAGHETIAVADLDAPALGVAARRGMPVRLIPLHTGRPPAAYEPLVGLLAETAQLPADPRGGDEQPGPGDPAVHPQLPHSTTRTPAAYAPPRNGREG